MEFLLEHLEHLEHDSHERRYIKGWGLEEQPQPL